MSTLRLYNTLTRSLDDFAPIDPQNVGVYGCGPTVYRPPHIGNFRTFLFNDLLHRYLEWKGYGVTFVMNLTDVEDKIINEAAMYDRTIEQITSPMIDAFFTDLKTLGIQPADEYPRATAHVDQMITLVQQLIERGHAYVAGDSVYFDISSFPSYGRLSRIDATDIRAGAGLATRAGGIDADEYEKSDARDFVLWKGGKPVDAQVGAAWDTPWGSGRPGWHIECSAMSMAVLGETFDIHTGGEDLIFPHHEDEIAQSEGATGATFAHVWLHVKHLLVNGEKMSKSKQNDFTIQQLIDRGYQPSAIRFLLLSAQYRKELNFAFSGLDDARTALQRMLAFSDRLQATTTQADAPVTALPRIAADALTRFEAALDEDLNTPNALAVVFNFIREVNAELDRERAVSAADIRTAAAAFDRFDAVLGVITLARQEAAAVDDGLAAWVEERIVARRDARGRRDFGEADRIRQQLSDAGIVVEDTAQGSRWKKL